MKDSPKNPGTEWFHSSDDFDRKGCELCEAGDYESALQIYQEGLQIFPLTPELHSGKGHMFLYLGEFVHALAAFREGMTLNAHDPDLNKGAALALLYLNRPDEASIHIERARPYFLDDEHTLFELGLALYQVGRYEDTEALLRTVTTLNPLHVDAALYLGLALHYGNGDPHRKIEALQSARDLDPDRQDIAEHLAHVHFEDGRALEAALLFDRLMLEHVTDEVTLERMLEVYKGRCGSRRKRIAVKRRLREIRSFDSTEDLIRDLLLDWDAGTSR
ncbi:MAG: tetratricopeptide repeat protein [Planctomycetota bacterium]